MNKQEIPIMFCFDNNYVIPAAVAFYSMLENCNKNYFYRMYVLHTDISNDNQQKLKDNIKKFSSFSDLTFINMNNKFEELWRKIETKGHFSKEVMYKVLVASIFPKYDKIITSDVDVVFLNDISESYFSIDSGEDYYLAGIKIIGKLKWYMDQYLRVFTKEEVEKLSGFCGGYIVFNLKKLREDNMEEKFIKCFENDGYRINQMEQDVLNLCCYPKTKRIPLKYLACSYMWDEYKTEKDMETDIYYKKEEIEDAMKNTVQLHYATSKKPWKDVDCTKSEVWFEYLMKTNFVVDYLKSLPNKIVIPQNRVKQIQDKNEELLRKNITNELVPKITAEVTETLKREYIENKRNSTIKAKINNKFGKYRWFRIMKYIWKNPFFLFKASFYKKLKEKINNKLDKQDFSLIILDDVFPSIYSPFRYEEYTKYFLNIKSVYAFSTGLSLHALSEKRKMEEVIEEFYEKFPQLKERVYELNNDNINKIKGVKNKVAIVTFLQNMQNNLEIIEKYKIPFIFTLYPGGGFILNDKESDEKLKRICKSKYFKKVIVTQDIVNNYLLDKNICNKDKIEFIYGIVTPKEILNNNIENKRYYEVNKDTLDICFVAHKYSDRGIDKGYDLFIESAKKLAKHKNIKFHVIGGFDESDIDVTELKDKIKFYGIKPSDWLRNFYKEMDIIISPNRPFILSKGSFDGFPTGSCTEAMVNGVLLICTDELNLNVKFKNSRDLIIIKPTMEDIVREVEMLYNNPNKLINIAKCGQEKCKKIYSEESQVTPRIKLIKRIAKKHYNY